MLSLVREPRLACVLAHRRAVRRLLRPRRGEGARHGRWRSPCTSGTAAANLAPAVIEAFQARVPLIVLDRRPAAGAARGRAPGRRSTRSSCSAARCVGSSRSASTTPRRSACAGCAPSPAVHTGPRSGAVPPARCTSTSPCASRSSPGGELPEDPVPGRPGRRPVGGAAEPPAPRRRPAPVRRPPAGDRRRRGAARRGRGRRGPGARRCCRRCRRGAVRRRSPTTTCCSRPRAFTAAHRPELVVRIGELPTSKPLRTWLAGLDDVEQVDGRSRRHAGRTRRRRRRPPGLGAARAAGRGRPAGWLAAWRAADRSVADAIEATLGEGLSEPARGPAPGRVAPAPRRHCSSPPRCRSATSRSSSPRATAGPRVLANRGARTASTARCRRHSARPR